MKVSHAKHLPAENEDADWNKCSACDYKSLYQVALKKHITVKHVGMIGTHKCEICSRTFSSQSGVVKHKKQNHEFTSTSTEFFVTPDFTLD